MAKKNRISRAQVAIIYIEVFHFKKLVLISLRHNVAKKYTGRKKFVKHQPVLAILL